MIYSTQMDVVGMGRRPRRLNAADRLASTIRYYDGHAESYAASTMTIDTSDRVDRFVDLLSRGAEVLDAGCGAGRDLVQLASRGVAAVGLDISPRLAAMARRTSGRPVVVGDLRSVDLEPSSLDGIWAMASLLHLARDELPDVLHRLAVALRPGGILFASVKRGAGDVQDDTGRWFTLYDEAGWASRLLDAGLAIVEVVGEPADEGAATGSVSPGWISSLSRRP